MRHLLISALILCCVSQGLAQEALPPRFEAITAKNDRFRLVRILGTPELPTPSTFHQLAAFSADGKRALYVEDLSAGPADNPQLRTRLLLWDVQAKGWPREFEIAGKNVTALALSADGAKALLAGQVLVKKKKTEEKGKELDLLAYLALYDLNAGKEIHGFITSELYIHCVALAPDGATALTCGDTLKRWDLKQGKELGVYQQPNDVTLTTALAFLPDGKQFLAGYQKGKVRDEIVRWDVIEQKPAASYVSKSKEFANVWHLAVSRDGKRFAAGDRQPAVSLWETDTGKEINMLKIEKRTIEEMVTAVALADDGKTVLTVWGKAEPASDDFACAKLMAWDGETNKIKWSHTVPYRGRLPILALKDQLMIGGGPNYFDVWSIKDGKQISRTGAHKGQVNAVAGWFKGAFFSAGQEGSIILWNRGVNENSWPAHTGAISALVVSEDGDQWLSAGADRVIQCWKVKAKRPTSIKNAHTGPITSLAFNSNGKWAASGSGDRTAKIWDVKTSKEIATFTGHSEGVNAVAISPDDRWLASAGDDTTIRLWPVKDGKLDPDREAIVLEGHKKAVMCLAFSPDGKTLLSGSQDQTIKVWDWAKEKVLRTLPGHKNWVTSLLFVDGHTVLSTSDDLTVCWWDVDSGKEIGRLDFGAVGDCPRCLARQVGPDRLLVGSSSWLIYELQLLPAAKTKTPAKSSSK